MKILVFAALCFLLKQNSIAQTKGFFGAVNGGVSFLTGDLLDYWENGFNVGGRGGYVFGDKYGFSLGFDYNHYSRKSYSHEVSSGGELNIFSIKGEYLVGDFRSSSRIVPYGLIGLGVDFLEVGDETLNGHNLANNPGSETDFGLDFGAGIGFKILKNISIAVEAKYCAIFDGNSLDAFIPIKLGVMYTP